MRGFDAGRFDAQLQSALGALRVLLETTKKPTCARDVHHAYSDKYLLSEWCTLTAVSSAFVLLEELGVDAALLAKLVAAVKSKSVTLRFTASETCEFDRHAKRKLEDKGSKFSAEGFGAIWSSKVVHKIDEWFWKFAHSFELCVFVGQFDEASKIVLLSRKTGKYEIITTTEDAPRPKSTVRDPIDVNLTWLLQRVVDQDASFTIDRKDPLCHTPRRNPEISAAIEFFSRLYTFSSKVEQYFRQQIFPIYVIGDLDLAAVNARGIFVPVVPLFDGRTDRNAGKKQLPGAFTKALGNVKTMISVGSASAVSLGGGNDNNEPRAGEPVGGVGTVNVSASLREAHSAIMMPFEDLQAMLAEHRSTLRRKSADTKLPQPGSEKLISSLEGKLVIVFGHSQNLLQAWQDSIDFIEEMLRAQMIAAIGKHVQPEDFAEYMQYHNRNLFRPQFAPKKFCYPVRRPDHYPEGLVSLETMDDREIETFSSVSPISTSSPMNFAINAATDISFSGETIFHGYLSHKFSNREAPRISLNARARQFSSFLVMVGRIIGPKTFDPKYALILKDKDDLKIPLDFETIPSAKEFKESISSISEEQQRFAKAFRSMQLESTLFGVCVVQIKPQLERLLGLPEDGLTKEIRLTSDLLELMMKYQIPSDLLSFDGAPSATPRERVAVVKNYVAAMYAMINKFKKATLVEAAQEAVYEGRAEYVEQISDVDEECEGGANEDDCDDVAPLSLAFDSYSAPAMSFSEAPMLEEMMVDRKERSRERSEAPMQLSRRAAPAAAPAAAPPPPPKSTVATTTPVANKPAEPPKPAPKKPEAKPDEKKDPTEVALPESTSAKDLTAVPKELDSKFEKFDEKGTVRPVIINVSNEWTKRAQRALLANPVQLTLDVDAQGTERNAAFDLLDALTKSGGMTLQDVTLHCVIAHTVCFDKTLLDVLVQDNVNPIEAVEFSELLVATTIHNSTVEQLVLPTQFERVSKFSATKLVEEEGGAVVDL